MWILASTSPMGLHGLLWGYFYLYLFFFFFFFLLLLLLLLLSSSSSSPSSECSAQGQVLHCKRRNQGCSSAEGRSSTANSGTKVAVLLGLNKCGSFPLLSAPHSLFSIWTDIMKSEKIPGAPTWRWGEWIWLTGPSWLHRNSPQELNISSIRVFDQIRDLEIPVTLRPLKIQSGRKRNWLGHWLSRNCLLKDAVKGMLNGKKVHGRRRYQMIDNITINGLYEDTKGKAEKRGVWRMLSLQRKTCPWQNNIINWLMIVEKS